MNKIKKEEEDEVYSVEEILDHATSEKGTKYYIKWEGYDTSFNTWEYEENLNCPEILEKYLSKLNEKEQPHTKKKLKPHNTNRPSRSNSIKLPTIPYEENEKIPVILNYPSEKVEKEWSSWEVEAEMICGVKKYNTTIYVIVAWKSGIFSAVEISLAHKKLQNHMLDFYLANLRFH